MIRNMLLVLAIRYVGALPPAKNLHDRFPKCMSAATPNSHDSGFGLTTYICRPFFTAIGMPKMQFVSWG